MLEGLSSSLQKAMGRLRGKGKLSEADVAEAMREVRLALLAADVNVKVVRDFVERVRERAVGQDVQKSLTPGQQVVRIVYEELTELMGGSQARIQMASKPLLSLCSLACRVRGRRRLSPNSRCRFASTNIDR